MKVVILIVAMMLVAGASGATEQVANSEVQSVSVAAISPNTAEDWYRYGVSFARGNRHIGDASEAIGRALSQSESNYAAILRGLSLAYAWRGDYDLALAQLEQGFTADNDNPQFLEGRADILAWKGDLESAASTYETLVTKFPNNENYWLRLGHLYALQGRNSDALKSYERSLSLDSRDVDVYVGLASVYASNHQYDKAEKLLLDALTIYPTNIAISNALTEIAKEKSLSKEDIVHVIEVIFFAGVILVLAYDVWRDRRRLMRRKLSAGVLVPGVMVLLVFAGAVYVETVFSGPYYTQLATIAQLLEPVSLAALITLTLLWRLHFKRPLRQKTVLAIGAHPDDIEFGCGATLSRLRDEGAVTYGLVMTGGEQGHSIKGKSTVRVEEACLAAEVMALCDVSIQGFPDTSLAEHKAEIRKVIEEALARWRPDIIFTHNGHDVHADHHAVYEATREAARGAYTILCYENPNTPPIFKPGYFYDIGNYIEKKVAALECHKSQLKKSYTAAAVVRSIAGFRGTQARVQFAEGFEVLRVLDKSKG